MSDDSGILVCAIHSRCVLNQSFRCLKCKSTCRRVGDIEGVPSGKVITALIHCPNIVEQTTMKRRGRKLFVLWAEDFKDKKLTVRLTN